MSARNTFSITLTETPVCAIGLDYSGGFVVKVGESSPRISGETPTLSANLSSTGLSVTNNLSGYADFYYIVLG